MKEQGLFDEIVSRLGDELKQLLELVSGGQVPAGALEHRLLGLLRSTGREAAGVLLESADAFLCREEKLHDRRTRTVMTLFGPVDITRGRTTQGCYRLDEALGLEGRHGWTAAVQEAVSLLACERGFETVCDLPIKRACGAADRRVCRGQGGRGAFDLPAAVAGGSWHADSGGRWLSGARA